MSSSYRSRADQRTADDVAIDQALMCRASGCPNRWTVDAGNGKCCSAHAWADSHEWPAITQRQLDAETERALRNAVRESQPAATPSRRDPQRMRAEMQRLASAIRSQRRDPTAWAQRLIDRAKHGYAMTPTQREMAEAVAAARGTLNAARSGAPVPLPVLNAALVVTGDIPLPDNVPVFEENE